MRSGLAAGVAAAIAALLVAACGATVTPAPGAGTLPPTGPPAASPSGSGATPGAGSPTAPGASASASASPVASEPALPGAFACAYPLERAATRTDPALVHDVRVGAHDTYDRIVFEFLGTGVPALRVDQAVPPFVKDPSGLSLTVAGSSFIALRMTGASGAGYASPNGQPSYTGPTAFQPGFSRLVALVEAGDFEAHFSWIAGLTGPMCYAVSELSNPARLVIDVRPA